MTWAIKRCWLLLAVATLTIVPGHSAFAGTPRPAAIEFPNNDTMRHRGKPSLVLDVEPRDRKPGTETEADSF
jgi:hypothetical protein